MDIAFAAKVICDLSLWFCASSFILSYFDHSVTAFLPVGLMLLCCVLCYLLRTKNLLVRLAPLLGLAACVFWIHTAADMLLLIPPCAYCAWLCVRGLFSPDYSSCRGYFKTSAIVLSVLILAAYIVGGGQRVEKYALPYFLTFLFSGVVMLRLLRHDEQTRKEWRLWITALSSLVFCCAGALFISSESFLHGVGAALGTLYQYVIEPILMGIVYVMIAVFWLFEKAVSLFRPGSHAADSKPMDIMQNLELNMPESNDTGSALVREILLALLLVLAAIIFIALAFKLFRRLAESAEKTQERTYKPDHREPLLNTKGRTAAALSRLKPRTPRETVRWYYRKFILKAKAGGIQLIPSDTSESITRSAGALFDPVLLAELRKIYIIARYSTETVTIDDVRRAREIYGSLKTK